MEYLLKTPVSGPIPTSLQENFKIWFPKSLAGSGSCALMLIPVPGKESQVKLGHSLAVHPWTSHPISAAVIPTTYKICTIAAPLLHLMGFLRRLSEEINEKDKRQSNDCDDFYSGQAASPDSTVCLRRGGTDSVGGESRLFGWRGQDSHGTNAPSVPSKELFPTDGGADGEITYVCAASSFRLSTYSELEPSSLLSDYSRLSKYKQSYSSTIIGWPRSLPFAKCPR